MPKKRNRGHFGPQGREEYLQDTYGLTEKAFEALLNGQDGKCKICKMPGEKSAHGILEVDHDHKTGKIRGLLCGNCNKGLGSFKDNPVSLLKAIQYLKGNL